MRFRQRPLIGMVIVILVGVAVVAVLGIMLQAVLASPLRQFPFDRVTIISDPPPPDLYGQFSERTLLQPNPVDPGPAWRLPAFDDSGWQDSYPAATLPGWGAPVGGDFIWGGAPGASVGGGRYEIPPSPAPQFLFLRKNFCIPINADNSSPNWISATPLRIQVAADPGDAAISYNGDDIGMLPGQGGTIQSLDIASSVTSFSRLGRNTLAMSVHDNVDDLYAAVAYHLELTYSIDYGAITVIANPPSPAIPGTLVTFSQGGTGAGGDAPYTFGWDLGNGATSTDPAPSIAYPAVGTYTVTLVMTDSFGCPSAPVVMQYIVLEPTPSIPPLTPTDTPVPTNTPRPANTSAPPPRPANTPIPSPAPTLTPTPTVPLLLPATGNTDRPSRANLVFLVVGGILLTASCLLLCRHIALCD